MSWPFALLFALNAFGADDVLIVIGNCQANKTGALNIFI